MQEKQKQATAKKTHAGNKYEHRVQKTSKIEISAREMALDLLLLILEQGEYSHRVINKKLNEWNVEKRERAFATRLCEGTIERCIEIDWILSEYSKTPISKMKPVIRTLLRMSVYQIKYMSQVPDSAICNEAVKLAKKRGFQGLSGFVNGVLRTIIREHVTEYPDIEKEPVKSIMLRYSIPEWLVKQMLTQYDLETAQKVFSAFLEAENGTILRCNESRMEKNVLLEKMRAQGIFAEDAPYIREALLVKEYNRVEELPGFAEGAFYVQDVSSMLAVRAAGLKKGDKVLDVCAAPGGKSLYAAELLTQYGAGTVESRDVSEYKVGLLQENIARSGYTNMTATCHDATVKDEAAKDVYDVVIADLPCSGLGIVGKKPEIKYRVTKQNEEELCCLQRKILDTIADYVKVGGTLLYSTCTWNKQENEENFKWFCKQYGYEPISLEDTLPEELLCETTKNGYLQLLPGVHKCDGFFLAKCKRVK